MDTLCERCAGIAVHKRSVVACRLTRAAQGIRVAQTQPFGTTTGELLRRCDWLAEGGCTPVGLARTGQFWKPVFTLLEGTCAVWLLNAAHSKAVPGRKTDGKDARDGSRSGGHTGWCVPAASPHVHNARGAT